MKKATTKTALKQAMDTALKDVRAPKAVRDGLVKPKKNNKEIFKPMKVFSFLYCGCIHESGYETISIHKTKKGAIDAMKKDKAEALEEYKEGVKERTKFIMSEKNLTEKEKKYLIKQGSKFGAHEDWMIIETEVLP